MKPFLKWAGGKRQILGRINEWLSDFDKNDSESTYIEPFLGGGAVFFDRTPKNAIINDLNEDLINAYRVIQSEKIDELIAKLKEHKAKYTEDPEEHYYEVRRMDREIDWPDVDSVTRAARMIFLNKTCYNGLYRVNGKGQFNTPIGRYRNPLICDEANLREIHEYLSNSENHIQISCGTYERCIADAKEGDIIYIDPPYDYEDDDGFTKYQMQGFTFEDFKRLKKTCDEALSRMTNVLISNNATEKVLNLFAQDPRYQIFYFADKFVTKRNINCIGTKRMTGVEVLIFGSNTMVPFPRANDLEKIVKILEADESLLADNNEMMKLMDVSTSKQVGYYLSAMHFLGYITFDKHFTDSAKAIQTDEPTIRKGIFNELKKRPVFKSCYYKWKEIGIVPGVSKIVPQLQSYYPDAKESTIRRRASTIKSWVEWMIDNGDTLERNE